MKKSIFILAAAASLSMSATAQKMDSTAAMYNMPALPCYDEVMGRWTLDINARVGSLTHNPTYAASTDAYSNAIGSSTNLGLLRITDGVTYGGDAQLGFFFGERRHWGIGAGFMYLVQRANAKLDNYHVEFQATDRGGNIYRQLITGRNLEERLEITNLNIPIVAKYKTRFSRTLGFTADAGILVNVDMKNETQTKASFDYEAIYTYNNNGVAYYNSTPGIPANAQVITRDYYLGNNPEGNVYNFFASQYNLGSNVGLGVRPDADKRERKVSYNTGSVGFIVQPALSIYLSDHVALNIGAYYIYQNFKNDRQPNYRLTGNMGEYSSMLNSISETENHSIGGTFGVRFLFGKAKDSDKDGIPDKRDKCPYTPGLAQFLGCPDTDRDGIPDPEDSCATVAGLVQFHGCPDSDNDGIPDKDDACPYQAGSLRFHGCPDRDNDGIPDKDDACPDKPGLEQFRGCPDTDSDGIPDNEDKCPTEAGPASNNGCPLAPPPPAEVPMSTPILFDVNKTKVSDVSMPVLETAIKKLKEEDNTIIIIDGYTDITGTKAYNKKLSIRRAQAVKKELVARGADPKRIKIVGHGPKDPAASNKTKEGRMQNRRAVMRLKV